MSDNSNMKLPGGARNWDEFKQLLQLGLQNGGATGPFMAFMGLPYYSRGHGGLTSAWDQLNHQHSLVGPMFGAGGGPGTGGQDPGVNTPGGGNPPTLNKNPHFPGDQYDGNLIPGWWKRWYMSQGQYGGVPPQPHGPQARVEGLI